MMFFEIPLDRVCLFARGCTNGGFVVSLSQGVRFQEKPMMRVAPLIGFLWTMCGLATAVLLPVGAHADAVKPH